MKVLILFAVLGLAASQADLNSVFASFDANSDSFIEPAELKGYFSRIDVDGDCSVNFADFSKVMAANPADRDSPSVRGPFNYYDSVDGSIDHVVTCQDVTIIYNSWDADSNSKVTKAEFAVGLAKIQAGVQAEIDSLTAAVGK